MKPALNRVTQRLLDDPLMADKLRLVDDYIQMHTHRGRVVALPAEHAYLQTIVDSFKNDLPEFVSYVRGLRDTVEPRSESYISLHEFYRTLEIRVVQQERRERARRALAWLEVHHPNLSYERKTRWVRKLEQSWGKRRMKRMEDARRGTSTGRLSIAEREELLIEFWREIEAEIASGRLPAPHQ